MDYHFGFLIGLHTLATIIWVGGMFFAHMALRPTALEMAPPERLALWRRVLPRFFLWVWISIITLLSTGYGVLLTGYRGGIGGGALHVDIMQATGLVMMALFFYMFFGPWGSFRRSFDAGDLPTAARHQAKIRLIVTVNLSLGLLTAFIGATGTFIGY